MLNYQMVLGWLYQALLSLIHEWFTRILWWVFGASSWCGAVLLSGKRIHNYGQWVDNKGKILTGNHRFSHEIWDFPVNFPLNQWIDSSESDTDITSAWRCWSELKDGAIFVAQKWCSQNMGAETPRTSMGTSGSLIGWYCAICLPRFYGNIPLHRPKK